MAEYIEREATCEDCVHYCVCYHIEHYGREIETDEPCEKFINDADVVEVRHGKWETEEVTQEWDKVQRFAHFHNNPNCKFFYSDEDPRGHDYCPHCGAKMDGKDGAE